MSIWIAKLLGPVIIAISIQMITAPQQLHRTAQQFLDDNPLIFVSGVLAMLGGLTIVNTHNIWSWDWRVVITVFGWALLASGAARLAIPGMTKKVGDAVMDMPGLTRVIGAAWGLFGVFVTFKGYA